MDVKESLFRKNYLTIASILLMSFLILGLTFSSLMYQMVNNERRDTMLSNAESVSKLLTAYSNEESIGSLPVRMSMYVVSQTTGYQILVCDARGYVVSCAGEDNEQSFLGSVIDENYLVKILQNGKYSAVTTLGDKFDNTRYVIGLPIFSYDSNYLLGFVFLSNSVSSKDVIWRQSASVFAVSAFSVMVLAFLVCIVTTRKQVEPINQMAEAAHKFEKGDFSARVVDTERQDEIGELANAFNTMADSLEKSETRRREFIANVSHELKTPMTTIAGFADGILDGTIPPEKQNEYLRIISSETRRLSRLVRSMLDMSQLQASDMTNMKPFDLNEAACQAILSLEKKITDRGLDVDAVFPEEPIKVMGNQDSIMQVIYNLIDNAAKFAEENSTIKVEIWKQNTRGCISVQNKGETIKKEELPLIFERFHKTDRSRSMDRDGVGLGLYIVKTIMDIHNGDVFVTSEDGVTTFGISMSLADN